MKEEMEDRGDKELNDMMAQVQFDTDWSQRMTKMLIESRDPELVSRAQGHAGSTVAAQRSCSKLRVLQKKLDFLQSVSQAGSI